MRWLLSKVEAEEVAARGRGGQPSQVTATARKRGQVPLGKTWIRWAGKLLTDQRNTAHLPVIERFAFLLEVTARRVRLRRGDLLLADQRRVAHGCTALGRQDGVAPSARRLLCQAKARFDAAAPAHQVLRSAA